jgi:hypothetical protein
MTALFNPSSWQESFERKLKSVILRFLKFFIVQTCRYALCCLFATLTEKDPDDWPTLVPTSTRHSNLQVVLVVILSQSRVGYQSDQPWGQE